MLAVLVRPCVWLKKELAPDRMVGARETGEPLPHGGYPALAWELPHGALCSHSEPSGQLPLHPQRALRNSGFLVVQLLSILGFGKKAGAGIFVRALYILKL